MSPYLLGARPSRLRKTPGPCGGPSTHARMHMGSMIKTANSSGCCLHLDAVLRASCEVEFLSDGLRDGLSVI